MLKVEAFVLEVLLEHCGALTGALSTKRQLYWRIRTFLIPISEIPNVIICSVTLMMN